MKKIYLLFAMCCMASAAAAQSHTAGTAARAIDGRCNTANGIPAATNGSSVRTPITFAGERFDLSFGFGVTYQRAKPINKRLVMLGAAISGTGYLVSQNFKHAYGLHLDLMFNQASSLNISSYSILFGPAYSYNLNPFGKSHVCLDFAGGYMFRRYFVSTSVRNDQLETANKLIQHALAIKAGISVFSWLGDSPQEYRLSFSLPVGETVFMSEKRKKVYNDAFENSWNITLTLGWRFGNY